MTDTPPLSQETTNRVLRHLDLPRDLPADRATLQTLLDRYTRVVPWESASRVLRRSRHEKLADCAALGETFWRNALRYGAGGTCFESNYAFYSLLRKLGYDGYLTINDMRDATACHTAIIIQLDGQKLLVDVGLPVYAPLPIHADSATDAESAFFRYTIEPLADDRCTIWREPHPDRYTFTLVDKPVADALYRQAAINDYIPGSGYFLDKVVINKVIDDKLWRFNSKDPPARMECFVNGEAQAHPLNGDVAGQLSQRFGMDRDMLASALQCV